MKRKFMDQGDEALFALAKSPKEHAKVFKNLSYEKSKPKKLKEDVRPILITEIKRKR